MFIKETGMIKQLVEKMVRKRAHERNIEFSEHAFIRMAEREIDIERIYKSIEFGQIIEFQKDKITEDIKVLFQEAIDGTPEIYVVVVARDTPLVITVCKTEKEVWDNIDNVLKRRRDYL